MNKICIIGVGLIGGSLGIDIKNKKLAREVVGVVRRQESIAECERLAVVDWATLSIEEGVKNADLVILATPISLMPKIAIEIKRFIKKGAIVIDLASIKGKLVKQLQDILGNTYIGTHPLAGSEKRGVSAAKAELFEHAKCIITPTDKSSPGSLKIVKGFWENLGAKTIILSPEQHDHLVAFSSHLPHLVAACLVNTSAAQAGIDSCIGPGFKDLTRIASSSPDLWQEVCEWNQKEILTSIDKFVKALSELKEYLEINNWDAFLAKLRNAKRFRDNLL